MQNIKQREQEEIEFVIGRFPVHSQNHSFMPYNIYLQTQQQGIQKSITLKLPCVRQGCTTSCYFSAQSLNKQNRKEACMICGNSLNGKIYLDIGFKHFINKHRKYISQFTPLNVIINPNTNQYYFSPKTLKNNLESTLTRFIAGELIKQMKFDQSPLIEQQHLDIYKINKEIKSIFKPPLEEKPYYVYNFCKYHPLIQQNSTDNHLVLFIKGIDKPLKVKLQTQQGKQICDNSTYLKYTKIVLLGNINTFIFCVPNKRKTEYFVSNCNYHLQLQQKVLVVIHKKSWRDELPRLNGSLLADQINNSVFAIGGYDNRKKDSLDYISWFINCRWQIHKNALTFLSETQKNHHLFANGNNQSSLISSYFKQNSNISKFAIINSSYLISSNPSNKYNKQNNEKYGFLSIGGAIKDSIFFGSSKFVTKPPGIRTIIYDKKFELNPIIHHTFESHFHLRNSNYIVIELPHVKTVTQKSQLHQFLLLGENKSLPKQNDKQSKDNTAFIFNHLKLEQPQIINTHFDFSQFLTDNIDQNSVLLFDDLSKEHYVQTIVPFAKPIQLLTKIYAYCLIIEFHLSSGCLNYRPGLLSFLNNKVEIQSQDFEIVSKDRSD